MNRTLIGILVAGVAVYLWGFLYWGATLIPYASWKSTANDAVTQQVLRDHFPESGTYFIPSFGNPPEKLAELYEAGPVGFVHINIEGRSQVDPVIMVSGVVLNIVVAGLMAGLMTVAGAREFRDFARISLAAGAVAVVLIDVGDTIWWQTDIGWKMWQIAYDFSAFVIVGHVLGIFMKEKSEPA